MKGGGEEQERGRRKQGINTPMTGIDDRYPKSSFFHRLPCENRRIRDSARGRAWNGACVRRSHPAPHARALCRRTVMMEGSPKKNTPR